ncbi:hypothetical protein [Actinoplanes sp. NPDC026619]|uniref:hypothetical protein n=1 Tax=Actinoplanes sp. NPDC026619 TaxID=3155798 RepID=UPI0033C22D7A
MAETNGLTDGEYLVLAPLEGGAPRPLSEIADDFIRLVASTVPTMAQVAAVLGPGMRSAVARDLIEVHRFPSWPMPWIDGVRVGAGELRGAGIWAEREDSELLAARITDAGARCL